MYIPRVNAPLSVVNRKLITMKDLIQGFDLPFQKHNNYKVRSDNESNFHSRVYLTQLSHPRQLPSALKALA